ncbi:MAG TPA: nuclear transport factor 2 family protein [Pyrinomonadaceae bacterium]|nr:nuclear transport factor 2 family protein [Pyrinomonadaceae bacterium]
MKRLLFGTTIILLLAGASFAQESNAETAILKVMDDQAAAWNKGDIEGYMRGYWVSEKLTFVSGDTVTRGWQATLDRYKKGYDTREKMGSLTFSDLEMTILSKDAAIVLGSWHLQRAKDAPHGKFTLVFRKFKEGWRITLDHTS